jgi:excisionase family DNA binding protein
MKSSKQPQFYSIKQCAEMLSVDYRFIYDRVNNQEIPSLRLSKNVIRIKVSDFNEWLGNKKSTND